MTPTESLPAAASNAQTRPMERNAHFVTVDSASTMDIDDAFSISAVDGVHRLLIAIADPTDLVQPGSSEDSVAQLMGSTVYSRDRAIRKMLPPHISERDGSLMAGYERKVFLMDVLLDAELELKSFEISRTRIKIGTRLSYEDIPAILQKEDHPLRGMIGMAAQLGRQLLQKRRRKGALALYDLQRLLLTDEEGRLIQLSRADEVVGHIIIQEFMVLANTLVAGWMVSHDIPAIFRNHQPSNAAPPGDELASIIEGWMKAGNVDGEAAQQQFALIMGKASYSHQLRGHFALAVGCYGHFTSPLRRYADLVNLRQIKAFLKSEPLPYSAADLDPLAVGLNLAADKRKEERSEGYKAVVQRTAERALERDQLERLADHEMVQALKLAADAGELPPSLITEVCRRLSQDMMTDKLAQCLCFKVDRDLWTGPIKAAFLAWLQERSHRATQLLNNGIQLGKFLDLAITGEADNAGTGFVGHVSFQIHEGPRVAQSGRGQRKRDAEQQAAIAALGVALGITAPLAQSQMPSPGSAAPSPALQPKAPAVTSPVAGGNFKGALLELCAKRKLPAPTFDHTSVGPSNAPVFSCRVSMTVKGSALTASAGQAATKKAAEAAACQDMLAQLKVAGI